jgi:hypothetical protein
MSATNPNQEIDTLKISQNADGTFEMNWDKEDPNWKWLNGLTSAEIQVIVKQAVEEELKRHGK